LIIYRDMIIVKLNMLCRYEFHSSGVKKID